MRLHHSWIWTAARVYVVSCALVRAAYGEYIIPPGRTCATAMHPPSSIQSVFIERCKLELKQAVDALNKNKFDIAIPLLEDLAAAGVAEAQYYLGNIYYLGFGVPRDEKTAVSWYRKSAQKGLPEAQLLLGPQTLFEETTLRDPEEARRWLRAAAEQGDHWGQFLLSGNYFQGTHGFPLNHDEGIRWLRLAANQGFAIAQHALGTMFLYGEYPVDWDEQEGMKWITAAAGNDFPLSCQLLSKTYQVGLFGMPVDEQKAMYWKTRASAAMERMLEKKGIDSSSTTIRIYE